MENDNIDDVELGLPGFLTTLQTVADWQLIQITGDSGCANQGVLTVWRSDTEQRMVEDSFGLAEPLMYGGVYLTESLLELGVEGARPDGPRRLQRRLRAARRDAPPARSCRTSPSSRASPYPDWLDDFATYTVNPDFVRVSTVVDINARLRRRWRPGYIEAAGATGGAVLDICNNSWGPDFENIAGVDRRRCAQLQPVRPARLRTASPSS